MKKRHKSASPFYVTALLVPTAEAAAGENWLPILLTAAAAGIIGSYAASWNGEMPKWGRKARAGTAVLLMAWGLQKTSVPWPGAASEYVVPLVVAALAVYAGINGSETARCSCSILRYGVYAVLGGIALLGLQGIDPEVLQPKLEMPNAEVVITMLLPALCTNKGEEKAGMVWIAAIAASILMRGGGSSLYEYSKGLSLRGITEHMESLTASAVTIGWYAFLCCMIDVWKEETDGKGVCLCAAAALVIGWLKIELLPAICLGAVLICWLAIPGTCQAKKKLKNMKKGVDK